MRDLLNNTEYFFFISEDYKNQLFPEWKGSSEQFLILSGPSELPDIHITCMYVR